MSISITLSTLANLQNETTAVNTINNNSSAITTAFGSALNTAGDSMSGNLNMNGHQILNQGSTSYTVATLPASPVVGQQAVVTDGTTSLAWGTTVTGGSSTVYLVWWNGSHWTVLGK